MASNPFRISGSNMGNIYPLLLLLMILLLADLSYAEQLHNGTTSAPPARARRNQQRLQQLQLAQDGIDTGLGDGNMQHHHHLRHEQHLRAELAGNRQPLPLTLTMKQPTALEMEQLAMLPVPGQQHHLRHHNRHHAAWEQRVFPALRHQQHRLAATAAATTTTTTTDAPLPRLVSSANKSSAASRFFDRDGIYPAWTQPRSTRAPNWQQQLVDSDEDDDNDEDYDDDDDDGDDVYKDDIDNAAAAELAKQMPRYSLFSQKLPEISSNEQDYDAYEQADVEANSSGNKHPSVSAGHTKAAAKRNIFDWLFKRDKDKKQTQAQPQSEPQQQPLVKVVQKLESSTEKPMIIMQEDSLAEEEDNNDNTAESFSNEQWNKIEHEHHLKQQKHQKELQALRESNRNAPLIRGGSSASSSISISRGAIDNEDADNNYSRNNAGKLTHQKIDQLGTQEAVMRSRRLHDQHYALAKAHYNYVKTEATCHVPQKRCVRIQRDPSKIYTPHCTILHRCSEDMGCCHDLTEICAPKRTRNVDLYFIVKSTKHRRSITEKLTFVNHTECHCIERSNYEADNMATTTSLVKANIQKCNCPRLFEKILQNDGQCRCDCSSSNYHCDFLKAGSEHFSMNDRKCIQQGRCKQPTCQFGSYMEKHGRCPNQNEQLQNHQSSYNALNMS